MKTVGVIGGLGPDATVDFLSKLIAANPAECDQDHIHALIDHNPSIPNRHAAISGTAPSIGPALAHMASNLEQAGADFLVMVCNTAHAYAEDIEAAITIPFVSIIDTTIAGLEAFPVTNVGVLAADGCLQAGLYQRALERADYRPLTLNQAAQQDFMNLVYAIKAGKRDASIRGGLYALARTLADSGAEALIAGCTEIPLVCAADRMPLPMLSSTDLLVARTLQLAREDTPL